MRTKVSEVKLIGSILLFAASLAFAYYGIFMKTKSSFGYIMIGIILGRFAVLLFRNARQKVS